MKIKEIIVVEGKADTVKLKRAVDADTIETNGSEISEVTLMRIRVGQKRRGIIVLTDPDYPGERIRRIISANVPGCKHAFLSKDEAKAKDGKGIGVEHASIEAIQKALSEVKEDVPDEGEQIPWNTLVLEGLIGGGNARTLRKRLGQKLGIGYMNGKQLYKRLRMFQITPRELKKALNEIRQEDRHE